MALNIFGKKEKKAVPFVDYITEESRDGIHKAYIPKFLYKPPFGYPRFENLDWIRRLARAPYAYMAIDTIVKEIAAIPWNIVPNPDLPEDMFKDSEGNYKDDVRKEIAHIKNFLNNPNTNGESFNDVFVERALTDVLEINSGPLIKVFNLKGEMVEIVARDGATFTKNPDIHGMFTNREDLIIQKNIVRNAHEVSNPITDITQSQIREKAAYFQYGWISGPVPTPFGRREVSWLSNKKRSDDIYAYSPIKVLKESLQMLIYHVESDLEYFTNNNVPKGVIGIDASDSDEISDFKQQWMDKITKKDEFGNQITERNKVPITNYLPKFERIQFTSQEMELISKQQWYSKMVWACFGVTPTELGYTEDAKGNANQIVQSEVFKKKAVNPYVRLLQDHINRDIIPEFEYNEKVNGIGVPKYVFKYDTFDIDHEMKKAQLYEKWIDNGIRTVNTLRQEEGQEPVDWGDDPPKKFRDQKNPFEQDEEGQEKSQKSIEGKPFAGYSDFDECVRKNKDKNNPEAYCADIHKQATGKWPSEKDSKKKVKANEPQDSPLVPQEGEVYNWQRLQKKIKEMLDKQRKDITERLEQEINQERTINNIKGNENIEVKGINQVINKLDEFLNLNDIRQYLREFVKKNFLSGSQDAEEKVNKAGINYNYVPDYDSIDYISNYTFDNIKNLEGDIEDNLRQELQRGYMNGEGISTIKKRVKDVFDTNDHRAETIARTEGNRATNFGKLNAYQQSGTKAKKWLLWTNDDRTSEITKQLHKIYGSPEKGIPMNDNFKAKIKVGKKIWNIDQPAPPFHPNERDEMMIEPTFEEN